jgi:4'-phosphopantetheinyl transferase EntD
MVMMTRVKEYDFLELPGDHARITCLYSEIGDFIGSLTCEEYGAVSSAVAKRKREYSTGRWLARTALSYRGQASEHLLSGEAREPLWPEGIVGSITHTDSHAAVAIARRDDYIGLGIDMEHVGAVDQKLLPKLLTGAERANLGGVDPTLIFSAKEASYKLLYPLVGEYVDFLAVEVQMAESDPFFNIRYIGSSPDNAIVEKAKGMYLQLENHWICCIVLVRN